MKLSSETISTRNSGSVPPTLMIMHLAFLYRSLGRQNQLDARKEQPTLWNGVLWRSRPRRGTPIARLAATHRVLKNSWHHQTHLEGGQEGWKEAGQPVEKQLEKQGGDDVEKLENEPVSYFSKI
jgi:hypothetical protein